MVLDNGISSPAVTEGEHKVATDYFHDDPDVEMFFEQRGVDYDALVERVIADCQILSKTLSIQTDTNQEKMYIGYLKKASEFIATTATRFTNLLSYDIGYSDSNILVGRNDEAVAGIKECRAQCLDAFSKHILDPTYVNDLLTGLTPSFDFDTDTMKVLRTKAELSTDANAIATYNSVVLEVQNIRLAELRVSILSVIDDVAYDVDLATDLIPNSTKKIRQEIIRCMPGLFSADPSTAISQIDQIARLVARLGSSNARQGNGKKSGKKSASRDKYGKPTADLLQRETAVLRQYFTDIDALNEFYIVEEPVLIESEPTVDRSDDVDEMDAEQAMSLETPTELKQNANTRRQSKQEIRDLQADLQVFDKLYRIKPEEVTRLGLSQVLAGLEQMPDNPKTSKSATRKYDPMMLVGLFNRLAAVDSNKEFYQDLLRYDELFERGNALAAQFPNLHKYPFNLEHTLRIFKDKKAWSYAAWVIKENWPDSEGSAVLEHIYNVLLLSRDELPNKEYLEFGPDGRPVEAPADPTLLVIEHKHSDAEESEPTEEEAPRTQYDSFVDAIKEEGGLEIFRECDEGQPGAPRSLYSEIGKRNPAKRLDERRCKTLDTLISADIFDDYTIGEEADRDDSKEKWMWVTLSVDGNAILVMENVEYGNRTFMVNTARCDMEPKEIIARLKQSRDSFITEFGDYAKARRHPNDKYFEPEKYAETLLNDIVELSS